MKTIAHIFIVVLLFSTGLKAQTDSTQTINLLNEITAQDNQKTILLPDKYPFTQRIFWGEKGLMRNFDYFRLTPEERQMN